MDFQTLFRNKLQNQEVRVSNSAGEIIGFIVMLCQEDLNNMDLLEKFTNWRIRHKEVFFSVFEPNVQRTKVWLERTVLADPDKIFFKILDANKNMVGHLGAINHGNNIEYDNLIRGENVSKVNFTFWVEIAFMNLLFSTANIDFISGKCLSSNSLVLALHRKTGFREHSRVLLGKVLNDNNEYAWKESQITNNIQEYCINIRLCKKDLDAIVEGHSEMTKRKHKPVRENGAVT